MTRARLAVGGIVALALPLLVGCAGRPRLVAEARVPEASEVRWVLGDSLLAVSLLGRGVALLDARTGEERAAWRLPTLPSRPAHGLATSAGGETLAVAGADSVRVFRARGLVPLAAFAGAATALALSGDGGTLAWSDGAVGLATDLGASAPPRACSMPVAGDALAWAPLERAFVWPQDARLMQWRETGEPQDWLGPFLEAAPRRVAFSRIGATLAVAESTRFVSFWDTRAERMRWRLALGGRAQAERMALSGDTWYLATAQEGRARIVWAYTGKARSDWAPHGGTPVRDLAFSADGRRLATTGGDGRVRVWVVPEPGKERR